MDDHPRNRCHAGRERDGSTTLERSDSRFKGKPAGIAFSAVNPLATRTVGRCRGDRRAEWLTNPDDPSGRYRERLRMVRHGQDSGRVRSGSKSGRSDAVAGSRVPATSISNPPAATISAVTPPARSTMPSPVAAPSV